MQTNIGTEAMISKHVGYDRRATRFAVNRNWSRRGDNTKYKETK